MTDTTTKERLDDENLVDAAARAAQEAGAKSLAVIRPEQQRFDEQQRAILRQLGIEEATDGDLDLFFHVCRTTGLDPFRRQIYMIGRNTKVVEWVDDDRGTNGRRKVEKWVTKYTIQIGIDGYRKAGRQIADAVGDTLAFDGPYWCGPDGQWTDVWLSDDPPVASKYTVFRNGEPHTGIAKFSEFVQTNPVYQGTGQNRTKIGEEPNSMWSKMPSGQIAKCSEALAYRRAFPDDFSGLFMEGAAQPTVIHPDGSVEEPRPEPRKRPGGRGTGGLRARAQAAQRSETIDGEVVDETNQVVQEETPPGAGDTGSVEEQVAPVGTTTVGAGQGTDVEELRKAARDKLNGAIFATFGELGLNGDDPGKRRDRLVVVREIVGRAIESTKELTDNELQTLRNGLIDRKKSGTLEADVTDWINADELRREGIDPGIESAAK